MLTYTDFNSTTKAVPAAGGVITFNSGEVPGSKVVKFLIELADDVGGVLTLAQVTGVRLKAGGQTIHDLTTDQIRAYLQRSSRGNVIVPLTASRFTLHLGIPDGKGDERYIAQFPLNQSPSLEITFGATAAVNPRVIVGWVASEVTPLFYSLFLREAHGVAASSTRRRYDIRRGGKIRMLVIPTTGLTEIAVVVSGVVILRADNALLLEMQRTENADTQPLTDPICIKLDEPLDAAIGSSYIELTTGATWVAAGEIAICSLVPAVA